MIDVIAFDADDTLWHNETLYNETQKSFIRIIEPYMPGKSPEEIDTILFKKEMENLPHYGYGIKSFTLSMVETAIQLTGGEMSAKEIQRIIDLGKKMIAAEVSLLPDSEKTLRALKDDYTLMVITKGDLLDQERKLKESNLEHYFSSLEVVSTKTEEVYRKIIQSHGINPEKFIMVGNSLKSDVLPVLGIGGFGVHIPYHITWEHEIPEELPLENDRFFELESMTDLPDLVETISAAE